VDVLPDPGFDRLINEGNRTDQHGALVTEIMPGQPLPIPEVGERVVVFGTWVLDTQHGWNEIHPIWAVAYLDRGTLRRRLPPATPLFEPDGGGGGATLPPTSGAGSCTPGYSPCLPLGPSDYDCAGGSGNGPAYTRPGVVYRVKGSDPYDLDSDADGFGCES
jgi:hypothetical protein